jgi:hypothetical protein
MSVHLHRPVPRKWRDGIGTLEYYMAMRDFKGSYMVENKCSGVDNISQLSSRYDLSLEASMYIKPPLLSPSYAKQDADQSRPSVALTTQCSN